MWYNEIQIPNNKGESSMKISPYLFFNGNCAKAIALYEKAFQVKAERMPYEGAEALVSHAQFEIGGDFIMLCDAPPENPAQFGNNMMITIQFHESELPAVRAAFDTLKEDGEVIMELAETAWSKCFGLLTDKFGVKWNMCQS